MTMVTLEHQLLRHHGRPSGFDYLRIILAVAVMVWHTLSVLGGNEAVSHFFLGPWRPVVFSILPMFFALSGFLVSGSLDRNDIPSFLTLRALRIFPALIVEVVAAALILGPLMTALPLRHYFSDSLFYQYFLNVTGWIHYWLPGVFLDSPSGRRVNSQLWTVPFELECYISISLLAIIRLANRPWLFFWVLLAVSVGRSLHGVLTDNNVAFDSLPPGRLLVISFLMGVSLYKLRDRIPFSPWLFAASALTAWAFESWQPTIYLSPLPLVYMTVYLGLLNPQKIFLIQGADYSYGIYLYGVPIQKSLAEAFPHLRVWWLHLPASLLVAALFAFLSWHIVEKNVLDRKKPVLKAVRSFTSRFPAWLTLTSPAVTRSTTPQLAAKHL